jgi:hypothetical protein
MPFNKIKWHIIAGAIVLITFAVLFSVRLGLFEKAVSDNSALSTSDIPLFVPKETWMNITQKGHKIGHSHRVFSKIDEGYRFSEAVFMRINTMGVVQPLRFKTEGRLKPDMSLAAFTFLLQSSIFSFQVRGSVDGKKMTLYSGTAGHEVKTELILVNAPHLANSIIDMVSRNDLNPGESTTFHIFDPAFMGERPVRVSVLSRETIVIQGNAKRTMKIAIDFMGVEQFAWIGDDATVVKEQGMLGIVLEQVTQKEALSGFLSSSSDLTDIASLAANKILEDPPALTELQVTLTDVDPTLFLDGDRQRFQNGRLTIRKESLKKTAHGDGFDSQDLKPFLEPSPFIQSDHPEIKQQVKNIVSPSDPDVVKAKKLIDWIFKHIEKRPVLSVPNALETLSNRIGDCNEHAALLAAMAQAAGIPAQIEAGLVYQRGRFYYHAWNVLYLGQWVTADAVFGQLPADVTHIRLVRGSQDRQMDLLSSIGRLKINIEDDRK